MSKLVFPIETEFRLYYGCYPYEYYMKRRTHGHTREEAAAKMQAAIDKIWSDMRHACNKQPAEGIPRCDRGADHALVFMEQENDLDSDDNYFTYIVGEYNPFLDSN